MAATTEKSATEVAQEAAAKKRRALVTGASSGLGETFARQLAGRGYDLVLVARRRDRLDKLAQELAESRGVEAEVIEADLSRPEGVALVEQRLRKGDIDMLVNNAGFATRGEFWALPVERETQEIDVNVRAVARLAHTALEAMVPKKSGAIINVASVGAFQPVPYMATYAATKAFVLHFSEALHEEARRHGIMVTCLCPGPVRTEFQQVADVNEESMPVGWKTPDQVVASALRANARGRAIAVPGGMNAMTATVAKFAPRFLTRKLAGRMFRDADSAQ